MTQLPQISCAGRRLGVRCPAFHTIWPVKASRLAYRLKIFSTKRRAPSITQAITLLFGALPFSGRWPVALTESGSPYQTNSRRSAKARRPSLRELITFQFRILIFPMTAENRTQLKTIKEARRQNRSKRSKPLTWGLITGLVGLAIILITILVE